MGPVEGDKSGLGARMLGSNAGGLHEQRMPLTRKSGPGKVEMRGLDIFMQDG